ncbi:ArsR/SmtB family transcription factor [Niallia taxi]|uniref:ArsR/SmtB family transcription factor n=1 Tax=Niallia taxi TaxID=2499688 RepID=UPI00300A6BD4
MDTLLILKALSNDHRLNILEWLKDPDGNFEPQTSLPEDTTFKGICVASICKKSGLAQSVISGYLVQLQNAGLLESERIGKWTYYRRNEKNIQAFKEMIGKNL